MSDKQDLKPCPFCGGKADIQKEYTDGWSYFGVCCHTEDCRCNSGDISYVDKVNAITAWNTRATPDAVEVVTVDKLALKLSSAMPLDLEGNRREFFKKAIEKVFKNYPNGLKIIAAEDGKGGT